MWNPSTCDCKCDKTCETGKSLDNTNCAFNKGISGKLVLACQDEMLNTTDTASVLIRKVVDTHINIYIKASCLIHTISLVNIISTYICIFSISYFY